MDYGDYLAKNGGKTGPEEHRTALWVIVAVLGLAYPAVVLGALGGLVLAGAIGISAWGVHAVVRRVRTGKWPSLLDAF